MIANGHHQVVIPGKLISKRKKDVKTFIKMIKNKMLPTMSLPLEIQTVINRQELRQLVEQQQPEQRHTWKNKAMIKVTTNAMTRTMTGATTKASTEHGGSNYRLVNSRVGT